MLLMHELTRPDVSLELLIVRHHETTLKYSWHFMTVMSYTIYKLELYILIIIIIFFLKMVTSTQNWPRINSFTKVCGQKWDVMSQRGIKKKKEQKRRKTKQKCFWGNAQNSSSSELRWLCFLRTFQCKHWARLSNQSFTGSRKQMDGTGKHDVVMVMLEKEEENCKSLIL